MDLTFTVIPWVSSILAVPTQCLAKPIPQLLYKLPSLAPPEKFMKYPVLTTLLYFTKGVEVYYKPPVEKNTENLENPQLPPCIWGFSFTYYYLVLPVFLSRRGRIMMNEEDKSAINKKVPHHNALSLSILTMKANHILIKNPQLPS